MDNLSWLKVADDDPSFRSRFSGKLANALDDVKSYLTSGSGLAPLMNSDLSAGERIQKTFADSTAAGNLLRDAVERNLRAQPGASGISDFRRTLLGLANPETIAQELPFKSLGGAFWGAPQGMREFNDLSTRNIIGNLGATLGSGSLTTAISGSPLAGLASSALPLLAAHQGYNPAAAALIGPAAAGLVRLLTPKPKSREDEDEYQRWRERTGKTSSLRQDPFAWLFSR